MKDDKISSYKNFLQAIVIGNDFAVVSICFFRVWNFLNEENKNIKISFSDYLFVRV